MSYNLLLDTELFEHNWKFINCKYVNGVLVSTDKVFGIEQELVLPDPTKLYLRFTYKTLNISIKDVKVGVQTGDVLHANKKVPRWNKEQKLSIIEDSMQEKVKLHLIFESDTKINQVQIKEPILCDLNSLHKSTWLKIVLDRVIKYRYGYSYINEYKTSTIEYTDTNFAGTNIEKSKIGSILKTQKKLEIDLGAKFIKGNYYLVKLDFEEINNLGEIFFKYGVIESAREDNEQIWLVFKANGLDKLNLIIEPNDVMDYQINLKHLLIINITKMKLLKNDVKFLPFI